MFDLNFNDDKNQILVPHFSTDEILDLKKSLEELRIKNHFLISSSGTSGGDWKGYLISKMSLLQNAQAVNQSLGLSKDDIWGVALPYYHIGGLSIYFRAHLLEHTPINLRPWSPENLAERILKNNISVISLVPAQVYDLVQLNIPSPSSLKIVLVGGDFISEELAKRFTQLGWPMIKTYGMTEVSSQLCTGTDKKGFYRPLDIHELKINETNNILIRSQSFFSYLVKKNKTWEFTALSELLDDQGFLKISDKGLFHQNHLQLLGRDDGQIKSAGHLINLTGLRETLDRFCLERNCWGQIEIQTRASDRKGTEIILHCLKGLPESLLQEFLKQIEPIKIDEIKKQVLFNRTKLGKFIPP